MKFRTNAPAFSPKVSRAALALIYRRVTFSPFIDSNHIWDLVVPNPDQLNGGITYYCHIGNISDDKLRPAFKLLSQILDEPAFNILRTQEQLGYLVFCTTWQSTESLGLRISIQSEKVPRYLETRIEAFLEHMSGIIQHMSTEEFQEQKSGLQRKWREKLKNLNEETSRFWNQVESGYWDFSRLERDAAALDNVTKDDILAIFRQHIDPASTSRSKVSVHMRPQKAAALKLSNAAAQAFLEELRNAGYDMDNEEFAKHCSEEPVVSTVKQHFNELLQERLGAKSAESLLFKLDELVLQHPAIGQGVVELSPSAVFITDCAAFRESLLLTGTAKPVADADQFLSKL
jgi:insulysin